MSAIQIILIVGVGLITYYMHTRIRHTFLDTVLIYLFAVAGAVFIIFPELTNKLAELVGVKRGANLIFYTGFLFLFFLILKLYARTRRIERSLTELIRQLAIDDAKNID